MHKNKKYTFFASLMFFLFVVPVVFAATSSDFQTKAQKYISNTCSRKSLANDESLFCYLYYKVQEQGAILTSHDTKINNLQNHQSQSDQLIASQSAVIATLQNRISVLETQIPTPTPTPFDVVLFNGAVSPSGVSSQIVDTKGYSFFGFNFHCTQGSVAVSIQNSPDKNTWFNQATYDPADCQSGESGHAPIEGRYYKLVTGSTTLPQVSLDASAHIY